MKKRFIALLSAMAMLLTASAALAASATPGTISGDSPCWLNGTVWEENNYNDSYDSNTDKLVSGLTINILDASSKTIKYTTATNEYGMYDFELAVGDYIMQFIMPEAYKYYDLSTINTMTSSKSYADLPEYGIAEVPFTAESTAQITINAILTKMSDPYLMGFVWYDANANKIRPAFYEYEDPTNEGENEVGIQGAVITVTNANGEKVADGETNERGEYGFYIPAGVNTVTVTLPGGYESYTFTTPDNGTITKEFTDGEEMVDFGVTQSTGTTSTDPTPTPDPSATASPAPSATATPDPSATATPTPDVETTPTPEPIITPEPDDVPTLNKTEHYAYVVGYDDGMIKPENNITRQEVATIFFRLLTDASRNYFYADDNTFTDVSQSLWSNIAISTMTKAKIVSGYDEATFMPLNNITRAEFATIAAKFDSSTYLGADKFTDISGHWAAEYINRAAEKGWISGYDDGTFKPDAYITRAEAMTLINNVLERHVTAEGMLSEMTTWPDNTPDKWYYTPVQEATNSHYYEKTDVNETWTEMRETRNWAELERK